MSDDCLPEINTIWDEAREFIEQGNYDKAIEIYTYVLLRYSEIDVAVEYANAYLGDIYLTLRRLELAERHIRNAIDYAPGNPGYRYILGFVYSVQRRWEEAVREFEIAVDKEPENAEYLRGLGWAVNSSGEKLKGLAYLHEAFDLSPDNVSILTDLAVVYLSMGDVDKATEYGEKAKRLNPGSKLVRELMDNIELVRESLRKPDNH